MVTQHLYIIQYDWASNHLSLCKLNAILLAMFPLTSTSYGIEDILNIMGLLQKNFILLEFFLNVKVKQQTGLV